MRRVELRRHAFTKKGDARDRGSHLSGDGVRAASDVGRSLGPFDYVLASTSPRTMETAVAMGYAVDGLFEMPSPVETGEIEFHAWREWPDPFSTLRDLAQTSPAIHDYLSDQVERLLDVVRTVDDGGSMLVVGHGGWLESITAGLAPADVICTLGGSFWHLDGVRLAISGDEVVVEAVHRFPQPARPSPHVSAPADDPANGPSKRRHTHSNVRDGKRHVWYTENLWPRAAELPIFELPLDEVMAWTGKPALDEDCWFGGQGATLRQVARHTARINAVASNNPIILNDDGSLMDGGHRLCRALLDDRPTIKAVRFTSMPPADEVYDLSD